jgi:hypothetical protein
MLGVIVTFTSDDQFDPAIIKKIADEASGMFQGMPGLDYKFFTLDAKARVARNFYAWESEQAGRDFFSDALLERVTGLYGVRPTIEFVDIVGVVDNTGS